MRSVQEALVDPRPRSRLTPRVRRDVLVDRAAFRLVTSRAGLPDAGRLARIDGEVAGALELFEERGWLAAPETYHREPPAIGAIRTSRRRSGNVRFTSLSWLDGYEPWPEEPGAARFRAYAKNRVARAALLEHRSSDRPWLLCIHGFGMGSSALDLRVFRALHLHRELGLDVAFLTLPFHGRRNPGPGRSPAAPGVDVLDTVHALAQAVWDARQLLAHLRTRTAQPVGVMGLSLGGLVTALVASLDAPDAAMLLVPAVDMPGLMADASARGVGGEAGLRLLERARPLYAPVSPLRLSPRVPLDARFILAGTLDRFARPSTQAVELWRHWDRPALHWYHGGHVSVFWARGVQAAIDATLRATLGQPTKSAGVVGPGGPQPPPISGVAGSGVAGQT
jgi:hypothetical protein